MLDLSRVQEPQFTNEDEERRHRCERLAAALRVFARLGYEEGVAGHISARDPGRPDHFWVNPFGVSFSRVRVSDLLLVDGHGDVVQGNGSVNRAAFHIHARIHEAQPRCVAAAHAHSLHGRAWASLGRLLDPLTQNACAFYEDHALFQAYEGPVLEDDEAARIASALGGRKALILQNHGLITVGETVDAAAWWYIAMERSCQVQLLAEAAGAPILIAADVARDTARHVGSPQAGWFSFQPFYEQVVRDEPELLQ